MYSQNRVLGGGAFDVRYAPDSGAKADVVKGPRCANNGLMHCNMIRKKKDRLAAISTKSDGLF
jgi:hypothetical protein